MRAALIVLVAGLFAPATAAAAPFAEAGERSFTEQSCVAATGAPGELARVPQAQETGLHLLQSGLLSS